MEALDYFAYVEAGLRDWAKSHVAAGLERGNLYTVIPPPDAGIDYTSLDCRVHFIDYEFVSDLGGTDSELSVVSGG